jgi:glucose/arabinose dehydrogenase
MAAMGPRGALRAVALCLGVACAGAALELPAQGLPRRARVETYKRGLAFPVDMAWVRGTRKVFFTEKNTGKVRVLVRRRLLDRACVNLDVSSSGERGALGIALHPHFRRNRYLYVYYTNASPLENRVARFEVRGNRCRRRKIIVSGLPAPGGYHNGGQLEFVAGKLFVATGEAHNPAQAQRLRGRLGKILRLNPNGTIPKGNPFSRRGRRSPVWSYGHRNPFGLAHRPGTRQLFETENGPSCDDELNRIRRGRNYGWGPGYSCGTAGVGPRPKRPAIRWSSVIVPTDPTWYDGRLRALRNDLYVGDYGGGRLHHIVVGRRGRVLRDRVVYDGGAGILDVSEGPRGWLYFLTPSTIMRVVNPRLS